ncbi:MAG: MarR family transcriptional regulator [Bacteroidetes bacterium]|jgi:MarR family 2-MHQ and catechol resistance regulon transcriptional repressor|nr:MarR family transcriptional regulator [Bacteroidota bacterium]
MSTTRKYGKKAEQALDLWVKLARASNTMSTLTVRDIATYGLTEAQFGVIEALGHLGPMKIGELCSKNLSSGGNMTVVVDNLSKEGLVERKQAEDDRRAYVIELTEKGTKLFQDIFPRHAKFVTDLVHSALSDEEMMKLAALLKKLGLTLKQRLQV